jgi:hypothetical protein
MRSLTSTACSIGLALAGLAGSIHSAHAATISAFADTTLTEHPTLGGASANLGPNPLLYSIGTSAFRSFPIFQFDLSAYTGQTVAGNGTLRLRVSDTYQSQSVTNTLDLYSVVISWLENAATWNNFGAFPGPDATTDFATPTIQTQTVSVTPGSLITFTVPQALIQGWINTPSTNHGFLVYNTTAASLMDISFASRQNGALAGPELVFSTGLLTATDVPEPSTMTMLMLTASLGALLVARRSRD